MADELEQTEVIAEETPVVEAAEAAPAEETAAPVNENFKWYIIHAYSGFERKVKESLMSRVIAYHLEDKVGRIEIPTEPTTEMRNGKKYTIDRVFLPGYVFVEMALDNDMGRPAECAFRGRGQRDAEPQRRDQGEAEAQAQVYEGRDRPHYRWAVQQLQWRGR
jgi:transcriptional antiterminator NusG